jgi:pantoate kinase
MITLDTEEPAEIQNKDLLTEPSKEEYLASLAEFNTRLGVIDEEVKEVKKKKQEIFDGIKGELEVEVCTEHQVSSFNDVRALRNAQTDIMRGK